MCQAVVSGDILPTTRKSRTSGRACIRFGVVAVLITAVERVDRRLWHGDGVMENRNDFPSRERERKGKKKKKKNSQPPPPPRPALLSSSGC